MMDEDHDSEAQGWAEARLWQRLGAQEIQSAGEEWQIRDLLANALPESLTSASLRRDVEAALIDALARKQQSGSAPRVVVAALADAEGVDPDCDCWSFFVIERPGGPGESAEVIEVCLYRE